MILGCLCYRRMSTVPVSTKDCIDDLEFDKINTKEELLKKLEECRQKKLESRRGASANSSLDNWLNTLPSASYSPVNTNSNAY
jgi:hypothetical protein